MLNIILHQLLRASFALCPCFAELSYCQFNEGVPCPHAGVCHGSATPCDCSSCSSDTKGHPAAGCADCSVPTAPPTAPLPPSPPGTWELWADPPGSALYVATQPQWYDRIATRAGGSFATGLDDDVHVEVAMGDHGAIHRFADPSFLQSFDDKLRTWNGAVLARDQSGVMDKCGWPKTSAATAPKAQQVILCFFLVNV